MDPFEVRIQFLSLLRKLNASQQSIQKVVGFALKFYSGCGEDLWDCIVEECQKGSINNRINILYLLDSLCESSLLAKSHTGAAGATQDAGGSGGGGSLYVAYIARDLAKIVAYVVPEGRQGLPNLMSTKQILESWRAKRVLDPQQVGDVLATLDARRDSLEHAQAADPTSRAASASAPALPRVEVFKRIEEDRERHKRLRERRWVQPAAHGPHTALPPPLAAFLPLAHEDGEGHEETTLDIEFENEWETTSDWNEDDDEAAFEENALCFPAQDGEQEMDLS
ncbi:hypothetical protein WOLCODRAFT_125905 [Wolfiporia cocos MD-104 SS10]|uniref:CID domain-containing protein n=1 Tax=Wolfiporia cocos (strain MD-104) TaxID=742152 RepID=A0A2H3JHL7_WOLCO|nr:hypothetical protein WOLCODRAFT_125905 [Wolfiporia cocos MD-104 SS10]